MSYLGRGLSVGVLVIVEHVLVTGALRVLLICTGL